MDNNMNINWFPGHMAKALKEIKEKVNIVDLVIELVDARAYLSSCNPLIKEIIGNKCFLKILNKVDLADDLIVNNIIKSLENENIKVCKAQANNKDYLQVVNNMIKEVSKPIIEKDLRRGLKPRKVRVMILGIPNVGKSTFINFLSKRKSASVQNKPGHTRALQWISCDGFDLLDTPGVLYPNLSNNDSGIKLALLGTIKDDILPKMDLCKYLLDFLNSNYPTYLYNKYNIEFVSFDNFMVQFAKDKKHYLKDNELDLERSYSYLLNEFKNGNIGKICFEGDKNG